MSDADRSHTRLDRAVDRFLADKSKAGESGNYRRNAGRVLREFVKWLSHGGLTASDLDIPASYRPDPAFEAVERFRDLEVRHCAEWARELRSRDIAGSTAHTYYSYVSAFLEWAVEEGHLAENPARKRRATTRLPDDRPARDRQQMWSAEQRQALCRAADERVEAALDDPDVNALAPLRDRALVYLLCYSGVRAGEVCADPHDDRRAGARWRDLNLDRSQLRVLGKAQTDEYAPVLEQAHGPLNRYRRVLDPAGDWPLVPTLHRPTLYDALDEQLGDDRDRETVLEAQTLAFAAFREGGATPPAMTTAGARSVLDRLCDAAGINAGKDFDTLHPHGARRGLGDALYDDDPRLAQDILRHQSIETTNEAYRERETEQDAKQASDVLEE